MSRAPNDFIQTDHASEYYWFFRNRIERELAYWLSPEQVRETGLWLATVLDAVELMILFERDITNFSIYFDQEKAVQRWRDVFLGLWDGEWENKEQLGWIYAYGKSAYRKQHRPAIVAMFDFLESVAHFWTNLTSRDDPKEKVAPLLADYPLPYFSIIRWTNRDNKEIVQAGGRVMHEMIEHLVKDIIYALSLENRDFATAMNTEDVWVAVDILGFMCETYQRSPRVSEQKVRTWLDATVELYTRVLEGDWDETRAPYDNVKRAFERLEAVARKYPPGGDTQASFQQHCHRRRSPGRIQNIGSIIERKLMSRAASDRIRSDHATDYYWLFQNRLERELAYYSSPEQVKENGWWLAQVLAAVELMILFERDIIDFSIYFDQERAVQRWRDVFLSVWDGAWQDEERPGGNYLYGKPEYRKQHRPAIVAMFNFLESVARFWADESNRFDEMLLTPLLPDYPLPYFSITRWTSRANKEIVSIGRVTHSMIEQLVKDIIYGLSLEKRDEGYTINTEDVWVAVDILGFLCETYEQSPEINDQMVRTWRETAIEIWKQFLSDDIEWDETRAPYDNVKRAFERLEAVALKYPPGW